MRVRKKDGLGLYDKVEAQWNVNNIDGGLAPWTWSDKVEAQWNVNVYEVTRDRYTGEG